MLGDEHMAPKERDDNTGRWPQVDGAGSRGTLPVASKALPRCMSDKLSPHPPPTSLDMQANKWKGFIASEG